jgi:hypothetical protein
MSETVMPVEQMESEEACDSLFMEFPQEIYDVILSDSSLTHADVCQFAAVCHRFHAVSSSQPVWKAKFKQRYVPRFAISISNPFINLLCMLFLSRWPRLYQNFPFVVPPDWRSEFMHRLKFCSVTRSLLSDLSAKFYSKQDVGEEGIASFMSVAQLSQNSFMYLKDELLNILNDQKRYTR